MIAVEIVYLISLPHRNAPAAEVIIFGHGFDGHGVALPPRTTIIDVIGGPNLESVAPLQLADEGCAQVGGLGQPVDPVAGAEAILNVVVTYPGLSISPIPGDLETQSGLLWSGDIDAVGAVVSYKIVTRVAAMFPARSALATRTVLEKALDWLKV